jgi:hypothetical protein
MNNVIRRRVRATAGRVDPIVRHADVTADHIHTIGGDARAIPGPVHAMALRVIGWICLL